MTALQPFAFVLGDARETFPDGQRVELGERQAKRSGDSEVSLEVRGSRAEIESFGSGP